MIPFWLLKLFEALDRLVSIHLFYSRESIKQQVLNNEYFYHSMTHLSTLAEVLILTNVVSQIYIFWVEYKCLLR